MELITKTADSFTGFRYQIEGGAEKGLEEIGAPEGTTFIARNLFYNTPARKKFLKTAATEGAHVAELVEKIAMSHPGISIRFIQNNQNKLHTSGNNQLRDMVYTVFGREIAANVLLVDETAGDISVTGFVGKPVIARNNRNFENYFINGRYIKSSIIAKAIEEAYRPFMMQHKYPFVLLHFTMEPESLDVNVHPAKMELRFRDGEAVYGMVRDAISRALAHKELIPKVSLSPPEGEERREEREKSHSLSQSPEPFERKRMGLYEQTLKQLTSMPEDGFLQERQKGYGEGGEPKLKPLRLEKAGEDGGREAAALENPKDFLGTALDLEAQSREKPVQMELFTDKFLGEKARKRHRLIGQLFDTYWLVEFDGQLFIIDQHAAHEKVLFERTMASLKTRDFGTQMVSPPIVLTLSMGEEVLMKRYMAYFNGLGFEIEPFGGREYAVRGVPANLFSLARKELLLEMLDGLSEDMQKKAPEMIYEKVASLSCKAAVKGNHRMSPVEADALIDQLLDMENPYACPHGRPTIIAMSKYELEKKFKRIV